MMLKLMQTHHYITEHTPVVLDVLLFSVSNLAIIENQSLQQSSALERFVSMLSNTF